MLIPLPLKVWGSLPPSTPLLYPCCPLNSINLPWDPWGWAFDCCQAAPPLAQSLSGSFFPTWNWNWIFQCFRFRVPASCLCSQLASVILPCPGMFHSLWSLPIFTIFITTLCLLGLFPLLFLHHHLPNCWKTLNLMVGQKKPVLPAPIVTHFCHGDFFHWAVTLPATT